MENRSITCRHRKLKCDEEQPICHNCIKSSRDCRYIERAVFRTFDSGVRLKRRTKNKVNRCEPFDDDQIWLDIPKDCKRFVTQVLLLKLTPYSSKVCEFDSTSAFQCEPQAPGQGAARVVDDEITSSPQGRKGRNVEASESDEGVVSQGFLATSHDDEPLPMPRLDSSINDNLLSLRLLRHFKEGPGQW